MNERRPLVIGLVAAALIVAGVADRSRSHGRSPSGVVAAGPTSASGSRSSTWFCPLANAQPGSGADGTLAIANSRNAPADAALTLYTGDATPATGPPLHVPELTRVTVHEQDLVKSPAVGAVVEAATGGVAVEQEVAGSLGLSASACATRTASKWYVADGSTALNSTMFLGLLNPFPDDAIVDLDFATDQGHASPGAFEGIVVRGGSVVAVNIGDHVRRRDHVAVTVTARRGRLSVARLSLRTAPKPGLALTLASPGLAKRWYFADGVVGDGVAEQVSVYNPSDKPASVQLAVTLDQGAAEPIEFSVPAGDRVTRDLAAETRLPKGVGHAITVTSDVPVVAEQSVDYGGSGARQGLSLTLGAPDGATRWLLAAGSVHSDVDEWLVVHNTGTRTARVSVASITGGQRTVLDGLDAVDLERGQRKVVHLGDVVTAATDLPLEVEATGPVVVERVLARIGKPGVSATMAVPVP